MSAFDEILATASQQGGYVATHQFPEINSQVFIHHYDTGKLERVLRGIYRVTHFPPSEEHDFIVAYLWSKERAVISHESALAIYHLSDVLPTKTHITLPTDDAPVYRQVPDWLDVHFNNVREHEQQWYEFVKVTTPARTLVDVALDALPMDLLDQAIDEAMARGLVSRDFERQLIHQLVAHKASR